MSDDYCFGKYYVAGKKIPREIFRELRDFFWEINGDIVQEEATTPEVKAFKGRIQDRIYDRYKELADREE